MEISGRRSRIQNQEEFPGHPPGPVLHLSDLHDLPASRCASLQFGRRFYRNRCQSLLCFAWRGRGIVDQPLGAFTRFCDSCLFITKDDVSVSWSPRLTLIFAINPIEWAPRFIGRVVYLASCCNYRKAFVIVTVIHTCILARCDLPHLLRYGSYARALRRRCSKKPTRKG